MGYVDKWQKAINQSELPHNARHVALVCGFQADWQTHHVMISDEIIAHLTGLSREQVRKRDRPLLVKEGWLKLLYRGGSISGGKRFASRYQLTYPKHRGQQNTGQKSGSQVVPGGSRNRSPMVLTGVTQTNDRGHTDPPSPWIPAAPVGAAAGAAAASGTSLAVMSTPEGRFVEAWDQSGWQELTETTASRFATEAGTTLDKLFDRGLVTKFNTKVRLLDTIADEYRS